MIKNYSRPFSIFALLLSLTLICSGHVLADEVDDLIQRTDSLWSKLDTDLKAEIEADSDLSELLLFAAAFPDLQQTEKQLLNDIASRLSPGQRNALNELIAAAGIIDMADATLAGTDVAIIARVIKKIDSFIRRILEKFKITTSFLGGLVEEFLETKNDILDNFIARKEMN